MKERLTTLLSTSRNKTDASTVSLGESVLEWCVYSIDWCQFHYIHLLFFLIQVVL